MNTAPTPTENHTGESLLPSGLRRFAPILGAIVLGLGLFGFLTGIREPQPPTRVLPVERIAVEDVPSALTYKEIPTGMLRPNAKLDDSLARLRYDRPGIFDPVVRTPEMRDTALADRARNRAYDGAPPTVPHPVDSQSTAACLACHGEGLKVADQVASRISHATMSNCTQCHVEQTPIGITRAATIENDFVGVYRAGPGQRASPGAPPTIPHSTWMRDNCNSCHGLVTRSGTRTTHPWLTSCTQCHAPSAALDQVDFFGVSK